MRLRTSCILLTGASLLLGAAVALAATLTIRDTRRTVQSAAESRELLREARSMLVLTLEASRYGHERVAVQWHSRWRTLNDGVERMRAAGPVRVPAPDLGATFAQLAPSFDALIATVGAAQSDPLARERRELLADMLVAQTQGVIEQVARWNADLDRETLATQDRLAWLAALGPVLMSLPLISIGWLMSQRVLAPVRKLQATMSRVELGDLSARIVTTRDDELGDLKRAFTRMTESLQASAQRLSDQEQSLRLITDNLPARVSHYDLDDRCTFANRPFCEGFGLRGPEDALGRHVAQLLPAPLHAALVPWIAAARAGTEQFFVVSVPAAGSVQHHEFSMIPDRAGDDSVQGLYVMARDVTERVDTEARIEAALHQKEVLLREVHHRVKNNMQIISSLLQLQSSTIEDEPVRAMLAESRDRIRAMALIHEKLYRHDDFARIDFADYVHGLLAVLAASHANNARVEVHAASVWLGIDQAVPAGLVLSELVTNAFKHAFPEGRAGCIAVRVEIDAAERLELSVTDDGIGAPSGFSGATDASLGLQLVRILADQLDGDLQFDVTEGFACRLAFDREAVSA